MKRTFLLFCSMLLLAAFSSFGQLNMEGSFGGSGKDSITFVSQLKNKSGYLLLGRTNSFTNQEEIFIARTDVAGNPAWAKNFFAVNNTNEAIAVCEANDGGYIVIFYKNGEDQIRIAKITEGKTSFDWIKGQSVSINNKGVHAFVPVSDGYILSIYQTDGGRGMVLKIANDGSVTSVKYEDHGEKTISDVYVTKAGRIFLAGTTIGADKIFLQEVSSNLTEISTKFYTVTMQQSNPAKVSHVVMGEDVINNKLLLATYATNANVQTSRTIIVTDSDGGNAKAYQYGKENEDDFYINDIAVVNDGYVFAGYSSASYSNSLGGKDVAYIKTDFNLKPQTVSIFGGTKYDEAIAVFTNTDNTVTVFANTRSFSKNGNTDYYAIKTGSAGNALCNEKSVECSIIDRVITLPATSAIYDNAPSVSATIISDSYNFPDVTFTTRCACQTALSFETSGAACAGQPLMVGLPSMGLNYAWDFGSPVDTIRKDGVLYVVYKNPGIWNIKLSVPSNSCITSSVRTVTVHPTPKIVSLDTAGVKCFTQAINLGVTIDPSNFSWIYDWDFGQDAVQRYAAAKNPKGIMYNKYGKKTVSLTVHDAHCSNDTVFDITIKPTPTAKFVSNAARCSGLPVSFKNTGTVGATYNWTFGDPSVSASAVENPEATYNAAGLKTVQLVTSLGTCTDTAKETITVYATPQIGTITIAPSQAAAGNNFCEGSRFDASTTVTPASEHVTYSWDFGADAQQKTSTDAAPKAIVYTKAGTKTVSLTVQSEHCTSLSQTASVIVNAKPKADFASTSPQCTGEKVSFVSIGTAGVSYSWKFSTDATVISGAGSREVFASFATPGEKSIELVAGIGSCFDTIRHGLTINKTPVVNFTFDTLVAYKKHCAGDLVQLKNTGETGVDWNYAWNLGESAQPAVATTENPRVAYSFGGKKHITLKIASDYCSASIDTIIYIDTLPHTIIAAKGFEVGMKDIRICANTTVELSAATNNTTDKIYTWYLPTNAFETQKQVRSNSVVVAPKAAETVYTLKTVDKNTACEFTDSILVVMLPAAIANAGVDVAICRGESIQIGAGLIEGQTYSWTPTASLSSITASNPVATPDSTTRYTLSVRYRDCPAETDQVVVTVHQLPKVQATDYLHKDSTQIARGESIQLIVIGALQYIWSPLEGLSNEGVYNPVASPENTTLYRVRGTDIFGCSNTDSIKVTVLTPKIWVPTAFTPNDDNLNEGFRVRGEGISKFELYVFTRAGEQVFYSKDQKQAWEGRKEGSNTDLPQGAYIYYTKGTLSDGALFEKRGVINLIR